ncbi:hypothetical protein EMCRGX_G013885 [Ephydatia muelleri]
MHSLRAGGATAAANAGVPDRLFKRHGRWKSESAKDGYVKDSVRHGSSPAAAIHFRPAVNCGRPYQEEEVTVYAQPNKCLLPCRSIIDEEKELAQRHREKRKAGFIPSHELAPQPPPKKYTWSVGDTTSMPAPSSVYLKCALLKLM